MLCLSEGDGTVINTNGVAVNSGGERRESGVVWFSLPLVVLLLSRAVC